MLLPNRDKNHMGHLSMLVTTIGGNEPKSFLGSRWNASTGKNRNWRNAESVLVDVKKVFIWLDICGKFCPTNLARSRHDHLLTEASSKRASQPAHGYSVVSIKLQVIRSPLTLFNESWTAMIGNRTRQNCPAYDQSSSTCSIRMSRTKVWQVHDQWNGRIPI